MKVRLWRQEDGAPAFAAGDSGTLYSFTEGDDDAMAVAFTKAVNDIMESGEDVEGDAAVQVADVLKEAGKVAWPANSGYDELRNLVREALPKGGGSGYEAEHSPFYVQDIALDAQHALVCGYEDNEEKHYVIPFTVHGTGTDLTVVAGDRSAWVAVEREFVTKAGRMFSARNLDALREAHESLGTLIATGLAALPTEVVAEEAGEEETQKADEPTMAYTVEKTDAAMRYTLGPLYAPMREDAHGEWIEDEALHKSLHEFVRDSSDSGRRINLQHGDRGDITCGEWVECVRWPYEHTIKMTNSKGEEHEVEMPAGTVYLGVVWDEDYWDVEKSAPKGIDGYSLGGRAVKVKGTSEALKNMGYKVKKAEG